MRANGLFCSRGWGVFKKEVDQKQLGFATSPPSLHRSERDAAPKDGEQVDEGHPELPQRARAPRRGGGAEHELRHEVGPQVVRVLLIQRGGDFTLEG